MANEDVAKLSDTEWLDAFVAQWHLLADLSFSDLLLWLPDEEFDTFTCVAQIRPVTGPTALEDDVTGEVLEFEPDHPVIVAYLTREIAETSDNELSVGIPVDVCAVPVVRGDRCIAILEKHTNQMGMRATGALEENYLEAADVLISMIMVGEFPLSPPSDKALAPKVGDGVVRVQPNGAITYASPNAVTAFRRMGMDHDIEGENFGDLIKTMWEGVETVGQTVMSDLRAQRSVVFDIERARSAMRFVLLPLHVHGESLGMLVLCRDTTDLRRRDRMLVTKDATIREIHHRVKNNLQTVAALLRMQSRRLTSPEGKEALRDANRRVSSIALVHDTLSHSFDDDVAFDQICDKILRMVGDLAASSGVVDARRVASFGVVPSEAATSLAMVLTELCQNAIEHGLGSGSGRVEVRPQRVGPNLTVDVLDDGAGLPEGFELGQQTSLGLAIISTLINDLGGTLELGPREDGPGTRARLKLTF
ncbi:sensor histidine kinase [Tessaracoccus sp. OS52]|uniref:sensor histidine kinase n=1 Tax=Tessaracoccus sp. OS52 TaxID=2886691 RepID=UPI001D1124E3|nr:sensor histidine kinase [Tessaracoccus sp. OS52]MCC2593079.1 sensor histidine kinase [Tessaracoccus sp. OS52]